MFFFAADSVNSKMRRLCDGETRGSSFSVSQRLRVDRLFLSRSALPVLLLSFNIEVISFYIIHNNHRKVFDF